MDTKGDQGFLVFYFFNTEATCHLSCLVHLTHGFTCRLVEASFADDLPLP
jgi:hypothetical protein